MRNARKQNGTLYLDKNGSRSPVWMCKYPPAEPVALRLLAPRRGLTATVRSKSKNKSKSPIILLPTRPSTRADLKADSRKCQTATATPAEPGDLLTL
jgi:hypothetical protein